jgi:hypothetical protein
MPWLDGPSVCAVARHHLLRLTGSFDRPADPQVSIAPPRVISVSLAAAPLPEQPILPREPFAVPVADQRLPLPYVTHRPRHEATIMCMGCFDNQCCAAPMVAINTTSLVDAMPVLLIIGIITAPLFTHAVMSAAQGAGIHGLGFVTVPTPP